MNILTKKQKALIKSWYLMECDRVKCSERFNLSWRAASEKLRLQEDLKAENLSINYNSVDDIIFRLSGTEVAKIKRQYSKRRINLEYKELKPKLIYYSEIA